jgi:hypothetical protein
MRLDVHNRTPEGEAVMVRRFRISYANVVSTLALFIVVGGGTAVAAGVAPNSVKSSSVADNSLVSADLKDGRGVTGADVRDDSLTGADIDEGTLNLPKAPDSARPSDPAGGSLAGEFPNPTLARNSVGADQIADKAVGAPTIAPDAVDSARVKDNGLNGADIADNTVSGRDVAENTLGAVPSAFPGGTGRASGRESCNPGGERFRICASVSLPVRGPARVLLIAEVTGAEDGSSSSQVGGNVGTCQLATSAGGLIPGTDKRIFKNQTKTLYAVTDPIRSNGLLSVAVDCNEQDKVKYVDVTLTAVALSDN